MHTPMVNYGLNFYYGTDLFEICDGTELPERLIIF